MLFLGARVAHVVSSSLTAETLVLILRSRVIIDFLFACDDFPHSVDSSLGTVLLSVSLSAAHGHVELYILLLGQCSRGFLLKYSIENVLIFTSSDSLLP